MSQPNPPPFVPIRIALIPHNEPFVDQYGDCMVRIKMADNRSIVAIDAKGAVHEYSRTDFGACVLTAAVLAATPELADLRGRLNPPSED